MVAEGRLVAGWRITPSIRAFVSYTFLYDSEVVRPGNLIDRTINPGLLPTSPFFGAAGPPRPAFSPSNTDFWAQGMSIGVAVRY